MDLFEEASDEYIANEERLIELRKKILK